MLPKKVQDELKQFGVTHDDCLEAVKIRPDQVPPRQLQAVEERLKGKDFDEIGIAIGVSRSRARDAYRTGLRNIRIWKNP